MAVGDIHTLPNGSWYVETEMGPMVTWHCEECGASAAAAIDYTGPVKCGGCWRQFHHLDEPT